MHASLKYQGYGLRIRAATTLRTSKFKWVYQFLSHSFHENTAMLLPTRYVFNINETFQMSRDGEKTCFSESPDSGPKLDL